MTPTENPHHPAGKPCVAAVMDLAFVTLIWLLALAIVNPVGNFPLNDDWSYGLAVKQLIDTGHYQPNGWESMNLITNVLWGRIFCLPMGFSFTALRFSTLAASWLGIFGVYWLMKELRQPRSMALLATLVLAFNPVYFALSNTFMTDVVYLALTTFAAIFFLKNLKHDSVGSLILGTLLSVAAILSRQVGLAVPLAFAIAAIFQRGFKARTVLRAALPLILCSLVLAAFQHWLSVTGRLSEASKTTNHKFAGVIENPVKFAEVFFKNLYTCLMYLGLFLSPFLFYKFLDFGLGCKKKVAIMVFFAIGLAALVKPYNQFPDSYSMPLAGNMWIKSGIGPLSFFDTAFLGGKVIELSQTFWAGVTVISCLGAAILICRIFDGLTGLLQRLRLHKLDLHESAGIFLLLVPVIYLALFTVSLLDRYLIPMIPLVVAGLVIIRPPADSLRPSLVNVATLLMLAGFIVFSVGSVHDYLEWNRVRWGALDELMDKSKIPAAQLDGGFEFDGCYTPGYGMVKDDGTNQPASHSQRFSWDLNLPYAMTFNRVNGYDVLHEYHYDHWLPPYTGTIYLLRNNDAQKGYFWK